MIAYGAHAFAGGFTIGVQQAGFKVLGQMEVHGLGDRTVREVLDVPCNPAPFEQWPRIVPDFADLVFGNPRCSGFSSMCTDPRMKNARGADAKQTIDIRQTVEWAIAVRPKVVLIESIQQAMTVGRSLILRLGQDLVDAGYYVTHVLYHNSALGVPQIRRRYMLVATRHRFVPHLPDDALGPEDPIRTVQAAIWRWRDRPGYEAKLMAKRPDDYDGDAWLAPHGDQTLVIPELKRGDSLNDLAFRDPGVFARIGARRLEASADRARTRRSALPFGFTTNKVLRLKWESVCPTLHMGCGSLVHPDLDRCLLVRELCSLMTWPPSIIPVGSHPFAQLARGIAPTVARWMAEEVSEYLGGGHHHRPPDPRGETTDIGGGQVLVSFNRFAPKSVVTITNKIKPPYDVRRRTDGKD